jgi:hypothetical protein
MTLTKTILNYNDGSYAGNYAGSNDSYYDPHGRSYHGRGFDSEGRERRNIDPTTWLVTLDHGLPDTFYRYFSEGEGRSSRHRIGGPGEAMIPEFSGKRWRNIVLRIEPCSAIYLVRTQGTT